MLSTDAVEQDGGLELRPAGAADEDFLAHLFMTSTAVELQAQHWDGVLREQVLRQQWCAHRHHYATVLPDAGQYLVRHNDTPIGRVILHREEGALLLADICLLPEIRGQGIGSRVVRLLQAQATAADLPLRLHVEHTRPALRLYQRHGFRTIGHTDTHLSLEWRAR